MIEVLFTVWLSFQVILLTYGPQQVIAREGDLFGQLLSIWNPSSGAADMPRAFMVNAPEREVDLIPDWLKLKMIRSEVPPLVDAALVELDPGKLVLFIQSFGIPVPRYALIPNLWENDMTTSQRVIYVFISISHC